MPRKIVNAITFFLIVSIVGIDLVLSIPPASSGKPSTQAKKRSTQQAAPKPEQTPTPAPGAAAAPTTAPGPAAPQAPAEKSFNDLTKDMEVTKGLFTFYRKDDRILMEIRPDQFDQVYMLSGTMESGIGERGFLSAQLIGEYAISLQRRGKNVQLMAKNLTFRASDKSAIRRAVNRSFADSILGAAKIEGLPHEERKSVLIDLTALMLTDLPLLGYGLESTYRMPYRLDTKNSSFTTVKGFTENNELEAILNYAVSQPPVAPLTPMPVPAPPPPLAPPDMRNLQFRVRYSLSTIPASSYRPRLADDRVGHFTTMHLDFTDDKPDTPYVRYINRWNLEKADASAALSPPKKPIVFWLENAIPVQYREALANGVLAWNKAFERIGFKDAIVVKQQPDDADWDPADVRYNTIRWFVATDAGFAIGPSRTNPYTGEIYDADISFSESMTRSVRGSYDGLVNPSVPAALADGLEAIRKLKGQTGWCSYANEAMLEASFAYNMLAARGAFSPKDEEQFVRDFLTSINAHEVGHTLGLRHNFRASTINAFADLQDMKMADERGLTGSVMDYIPVNIAPKGAKQGYYWQTTLGPYDYWAIEYAYKPIAAASPEAERSELNKIASRVADAQLAYGTDEDAGEPSGIDPRTNRWDYGTDPLAYFDARSTLVHELWGNIETKIATPGKGYQRLRRSFDMGFGQLNQTMFGSVKYIGGIYHHRDYVGDPGRRLPYEPVSARDQRRAFAILDKYALGRNAFTFSPQLLNKLAIDRNWTLDGSVFRQTRLDYPIHQRVVNLQRGLLDRLFNPIVLSRIQDSEVKYANPADRYTMTEMFTSLHSSIWSEMEGTGPVQIDSFRRNLQREYVRRLQRLVLRQDAGTPEDASTLARHNLVQLSSQINRSLTLKGAKMDLITKAHLQETLARVKETLSAQQQRTVS